MMSTWRVLLLSLAFLGVVGLAVWTSVAFNPGAEKPQGNNYKRLSGEVASNFVYRVGREKHPRISCSACRVGKMKLGLISLGAFNTIEIDDLVINVPEENAITDEIDDASNGRKKQRSKTSADAIVDAFNLGSVIKMANADARKFASIKISNFQLNQMSGETLVPLIRASSLKNSGKRMMFYNASLYKNGERLDLSEVELVAKPHFKLIWSTGSWDMSDMLRQDSRATGAHDQDRREPARWR